MEPKIVSAEIGPMPQGLFDPMPSVTATFDDGQVKRLFTFYPDEIRFTPDEFVGLTERQASALFHKKDVAYLRS
jgi:hypothetical protein